MSSLEQMSIQGIRSYGPKDQDTQIIKFFSPVTLIIGTNGSGKTTIIECLKYATTSDMPPNTKGSSFVFDPKLIDEVETKGRIKLYFRDTSGLSVQVQKNLVSTQKSKKLEFRTAETLISRYNKDNKLLSTITSKCINADAEVINAFGVTKSVLEHVIFCHQEDSNWPLSEGKILKTRFDEIFSATKYIKTLDVLRKIRLEKQQLIKQKEIEKKYLEANKNRSNQLQNDLDENERKYENLKTKRDTTLEKLKPIVKQLDFYFKESSRILEVKLKLDKIENEKELLEKQIKELLINTKDSRFVGSDEELAEYVESFNSTTNEMRREQEETIQKELDALNAKLKDLNKKKTKLNVEIGGLESKLKTNKENQEQLLALVERMCNLLKLDIDPTDLAVLNIKSSGTLNPNLDDKIEKIEAFIENYELETASIDETNKSDEKSIETKLEIERDEKSKLDQNILIKQDKSEKNKKQIEQIRNELKSMSSNEKALNDLNAEIADGEAKLSSNSQSQTDISQIKTFLNDLESRRAALRQTEKRLDAILTRLHSNSKYQTEIDLLRKDKKSKEEQIRKIRMGIREDVESFFGIDGDDDDDDKYDEEDAENNSKEVLLKNLSDDLKLKTQFELKSKSLMSELTVLDTKKKDVEKRLCSSEMKRKMLFDEMRSKEKQLREHEDKLLLINECVSDLNDLDKYDSILETLQEENKSNLDEKGFLSGVDKTYKRFLTQLQQTKSSSSSLSNETSSFDHKSHNNDDADSDRICCPICMRYFKDQHELDETIRELKKYSSKLPKKMTDLNTKIKDVEIKLEKMINMKPIKESYEKLKNQEIVSLRSQIDSLDRTTLPQLRKELKEIDENLKRLEKRKTILDSLQNEIVLIDKYANECKDLDRKIESSLNVMNASTTADSKSQDQDDKMFTIDQVNEKKNSIKLELETLNKQIEQKQDELNDNYARTDRINSLKEKINNLKTKRNELSSKFQKRSQMEEKQNELRAEIDENLREVNGLKERLNILKASIDKLNTQKQELILKNSQIIKVRQKELNEYKMLRTKIQDLLNGVRTFQKNEESQLANARKELKQIEMDEHLQQAEIEKQRRRLNELREELARHEIKLRELKDNMRLREKRREHETKTKQFEQIKQEYSLASESNLDLKSLKEETEKLEKKRDELNKEHSNLKTQMNIIEGKIQTLKNDLEQDDIKFAIDKYSACAINLRVLEISALDIQKYYNALDRAIMNYHLIKMGEINKIIKQLWRQVYRGTDIDYIEIRSEEESAGGGTGEDQQYQQQQQQLKTRRTYNYRVVLVKNDTVLDMRGRCSAGQKVLASIIIRLALAETFCLNSGVLALDEPTTNLDRENIESLATALVEIIKTRSIQKNFQLVIITHDEDFVEMLGRSEYMDQFYRVQKDDKGFSRISKRSTLNP